MDLKRLFENKWLLVLGVIGAVCLLVGSFWSGSMGSVAALAPHGGNNTAATTAAKAKNGSSATTADEQQLDHQLAQMLSKIDGIHGVSVMITFDSTGSVEVANNVRKTTTNQSGTHGSQSTTTDTEVFTQRNGDGSEVPYVISRLAPAVRGVLVTVNADDFDLAKSEIIDAITNVLDVPAYKISVEPQKPSS
jgi:stage III sporulation protein AG